MIAEIGQLPVAVVTASLAARGVVTALGWLGKNIRAFAPLDLPQAFTYLGVKEEARLDLMQAVAKLRSQLLGVDALSSIQGSHDNALIRFVATESLARVKDKLRAPPDGC